MRIFAALALFCLATTANANPPLEAYGKLPEIRALDFSPDGSRFAFFRRQGDRELMVVFETGKGNIGAIDVTDVKPRNLYFVSENHVIIYASQATKRYGGYEDGQASTYNVETGKLMTLAEKETRFRFYPGTAGGFMIPTGDPDISVFNAFVGDKGDYPQNTLLRGNLKTGKANIIAKGSFHTDDWLVTEGETILAREDYNDDANLYEIYTYRNGGWKLVYREQDVETQPMSLLGYLPDESALLIAQDISGNPNRTIHRLSFDGEISEPLYNSMNEVTGIYVDEWGKLVGVWRGGLKPSYEFFDDGLNKVMTDIAAAFPQDAVRIADWTTDLTKLVFSISGGKTAPAYFLLDRTAGSFSKLLPRYLQINDEDVSPVQAIEYPARDNLSIPALLTHPRGASQGAKLPLIIMPHGGPEAYSSLGFDHWAQYFANRGYLVLQPNFRGSAGFGSAHRSAGYGEWGGKMQDDLTDGVNYLVNNGWADPDRVCIIGGSYGGYAALAGGAFTPDLYKCVVALAAVTDIPAFLDQRARFYGRYSSIIAYWELWLGDKKENRAEMARISPVNAAASIKAPVLLLHGDDDTIVPFDQSEKMDAALRAAGKDVKFVTLKDEDHWLSNSDTRLQTLQEIDAFVKRTIGPAN